MTDIDKNTSLKPKLHQFPIASNLVLHLVVGKFGNFLRTSNKFVLTLYNYLVLVH